VNHTRFPKEGSPTGLRTSGQQSYEGWSCRMCSAKLGGDGVYWMLLASQFRRFRLPRCSVRPSLLRGVTRRGLVVVTDPTFRDSLSLPSASVRKPKNNGPMQNMPEERRLQIPVVANGRMDRQTDTWLRTWRNFVSFEWVPSILRKYPMT